MSLSADLRAAAKVIDPQFQVSTGEVTSVLTSVLAYLEHGDEFLKAAQSGVQDVANVLSPPAPEQPAEQPAAEPAAEPAQDTQPAQSDSELEKQISDLQAQLAARQATAQQTTVTHEPGAEG